MPVGQCFEAVRNISLCNYCCAACVKLCVTSAVQQPNKLWQMVQQLVDLIIHYQWHIHIW